MYFNRLYKKKKKKRKTLSEYGFSIMLLSGCCLGVCQGVVMQLL